MLGWLEIPKDEDRPPEEIWKDTEAVNGWFANVKERYANQSSDVEEVPLDQNESTRGLKERLAGR